ncbi:MAG: hypothetical protein ERJ67_00785, partial [Aphanocapsa feldmannii 277cV]
MGRGPAAPLKPGGKRRHGNLSRRYEIQQRIRLACGRGATRLWRNNTGALIDRQGRLVRFGLCKGSSDLIGLRSVEITAAMVGQHIGQFIAIEVKTPQGAIRPEQESYLR